MKAIRISVSAISLGIALAAATPAFAQDAAPQAAPADASTDAASTQGDIVVTALRRNDVLSKAPVAISAVSGTELLSRGVTTAKDIQNVIPNVSNSVVGFAIRGVSSSDFTPKGDGATAFNVNGVYLARYHEQQLALFDVDRVEVLRGPQGTLYGRNATGGVVNVVTTRPKDTFEGYANAEYGNYNTVRANAAINLPLTGGIAFRLAGTYNRHDGYTPARGGFDALDDQNNYAFRASLLAKISDGTDLLITGDYANLDETGPANIAAARALAQNGDHSLRYAVPGVNNRNRLKSGGVAAELNADLGFAKLTGIASWRQYTQNVLSTKNDVGAFTQSDRVINLHKRNQYTGELRLASTGNGPLSWVVGAYAFYEREPYTDYLNLCCFFKATFGYQQVAKATSYAGFGQATYSILDRLRFTAGLRWTHDTKSRLGINSNNFAPAVDPTTGVTLTVSNPSLFVGQPINYIGYYPGGFAPASRLTWKAQIEGDLSSNVIAFAKVETGYKAGSFNDGTPAANTPSKPFVYQPELITDYEGGIKGTVLDGKLYFSLGAFHYDYKNHQVVAIAPTGGAFTYNAPAKVTGAELEGWARPGRYTKFRYSASVLSAKYGDFSPNGVNFKGRQLDFAPRYTALAGITQDIPLGNGGRISADASVKLSSSYFVTDYINANSAYTQKAYTRTDFTLGYWAPGDRWFVQGYAKNVENERQLGVVEVGGFSLTDPGQYGVRAGFKF